MALLDLLGRRWALRVLWELHDGRQLTFRDLQSRCGGVSSSVLNDRLKELRHAGIVVAEPTGYRLTDEGAKLLAALSPVDDWAKRWARRADRVGETVGAARRPMSSEPPASPQSHELS
jgi:DNA-binding HxlR family transcriptional regulator